MTMQSKIVQLIIVILLIFHGIAHAAEKFSISAKPTKSGVRVIITAGENNAFNMQKSKGKLILNFKNNFTLTGNVTGTKLIKSQYVNGNSIVFVLTVEDYEVRKFISDKFIGVDITETKNFAPSVPTSPATSDAKTHAKPTEAKEPVLTNNNSTPTGKIESNITDLDSKQKHKLPKNHKKHTPPSHPAAPIPSNTPPRLKLEYAPYQDPVLPPRNVSPPQNTDAKFIPRSPVMKVESHNQSGLVTILFPWNTQVAMSSFYRAGYLWIIFNKKVDLMLDELQKVLNKKPEDFDQIGSREYTILRIKGTELSNYKVSNNQNTWVVEINTIPDSIRFIPQKKIVEYRSQFAKGIFFPAENMAPKSLIIVDPSVGDKIFTVPFYSSDIGVSTPRNFVEFQILHSAQGFTIIPSNDNLQLNVLVPGLEIVIPNQELSRAAGSRAVIEYNGNQTTKTAVYSLLPYARWSSMPPHDFLPSKNELVSRIYNEISLDHQNKEARAEYANFLFANDMWNEANGALNYLGQVNPTQAQKYEHKFLLGVVNLLRQRYETAKTYLDQVDLNAVKDTDKQEVKLWKIALNEAMGNTDIAPFNYSQYSDNFIANYSDKVKFFLISLNLKNSIANGDYKGANDLLSTLNLDDYPQHEKNTLMYYQGLLLYKMGDHRSAEHFFKVVIEHVDDPEYRGRSQLLLTKMQLEDKKINTIDALKQLDLLRNTWRGDDFEQDLLRYIATLYESQNDYVNALRVWKTLSSSFRNLPDSLSVAAHMSQIFFKIFDPVAGVAKDMPDFRAVSLFYEFRELTPIGKAGNEIIKQLSNTLIKLDLLDKAEGLLDHQYKYRLDGDERLKVIQKLALIYLIDKKPQKTIDLLNDTKDDFKNYPDLIIHNKELYAKALIDQSKHDQALELLQNINSDGANDLRTEIYWSMQAWDKLEALLQPKIDNLSNGSGTLNDEQTHALIKYALTLLLQEKKDELYALGQKFMSRLPDNSSAKVNFDMITSNPDNVDYNDLEGSIGIDKYTNFLEVNKHNLLAPSVDK